MASPVGKIFTDPMDIKKEISGCKILVTVGDVVTLDLLEIGILPDISVIDYMTKRMPLAEVKTRFQKYSQPELTVKNPAGEITASLWAAIKDGYMNPRKLRIIVEGEEDLASLVCITLAPEGAVIIYGIPGKGASVLRVDSKLRELVKQALEEMRV